MVSVWKPATRPGYKIRVTLPDGREITTSLGTHSAAQAERMRRFFATLEDDRHWNALALVVDRQQTPGQLYDARHALDAVVAQFAPDTDLEPYVDEWAGRGKRGRTHADYVRQVRTLIALGVPFPRAELTRGRVSRWLAELPVDDPTRNRYRSAMSQFARWLVERDVLETNPVRDVAAFAEHEPRTTHLSPADAKLLVAALDGQAQLVAALMAAAPVEWAAVARAHRRDLDLAKRTFHAKGSKSRYRNRLVDLTEAWAVAVLKRCVRGVFPGAPLVTITVWDALDQQLAACDRLGLPHHTLHDWRHTYAVTALVRGDDPQFIKRQLGHAPNSPLLHTTYGVYEAQGRTARQAATHGASHGAK
ncbi:MAG TPA: hypothetical protein VN513_10200 [Gemmatimonadales bacterium]|nr:hypothetical protein [Gemmatimonadales bacterium]